jgi:hypothetical protein
MLRFSVKLALMVASPICLFRKMRRFFAFSCKNDPESKPAAALAKARRLSMYAHFRRKIRNGFRHLGALSLCAGCLRMVG